MKHGSTVGRPRQLTDEQAAAILRWHEAVRALNTLRGYLKPMREFAAFRGVSFGAVTSAIRRRGQYKQKCPSTKR